MVPLRLRIPPRADFQTRQAWLADPDFMSYNMGWEIDHPAYDPMTGCIDWPESQWDAFADLLERPLSECGYFFVEGGASGEALGHVHYVVNHQTASIGFNVVPAHRGSGLGHGFLAVLLESIRQNTNATEAVNEFEDGRIAAVRVHRAAGFKPGGQLNNGGRPVRIWTLALR